MRSCLRRPSTQFQRSKKTGKFEPGFVCHKCAKEKDLKKRAFIFTVLSHVRNLKPFLLKTICSRFHALDLCEHVRNKQTGSKSFDIDIIQTLSFKHMINHVYLYIHQISSCIFQILGYLQPEHEFRHSDLNRSAPQPLRFRSSWPRRNSTGHARTQHWWQCRTLSGKLGNSLRVKPALKVLT